MENDELERRFGQIEDRLNRLEAKLLRVAEQKGLVGGKAAAPTEASKATAATSKSASDKNASSVTSMLGWVGSTALVLAAAYLIRLAIDTGWLTPLRQITIAVLGGVLLIGAGLMLRNTDRRYAGLLPAGGVVILFLSIYGAHLHYGLIEPVSAAAAVVIVSIVSLWLCRVFASELYAMFAVIGSYSAPFLLSSLSATITELVIYFSAWSIVFSVYSIWVGRRLIYLLAVYFALIGFDVIWQDKAAAEWVPALAFQTVQFIIFAAATVLFSIRNRMPLDRDAALAHLPALLIFYFLQYALLSKHLPTYAPWIAAGSALALAAFYGSARAVLQRPLPGGELLVSAYIALVLFHAGYIESVPKSWAPWVAFLLMPATAIIGISRSGTGFLRWPVWLAVGIIFAVNYLRIVFNTDVQAVPAREVLAILYALGLYAGYYFGRNKEALRNVLLLLLYGGHISLMAAAVHLLHERIVVSTAWGFLALACLSLSLMQRDRIMAQSSLLIFAAAGSKVLLYDLAGAAPVLRIVSLVLLGITFYLGGLLYQRLMGGEHKNIKT
ncbi:MAG TPA: DUF2339 domain-containing protein [Burkholderiales bacterium]|nr:DUF2339 domain-containing protein [Burkholderiales bacterium]